MSNRSSQSANTSAVLNDMDLDGGPAPTVVDQRQEVTLGDAVYDAGAPPASLIAEVELARRDSGEGGLVVQGEGADDGGAAPEFA